MGGASVKDVLVGGASVQDVLVGGASVQDVLIRVPLYVYTYLTSMAALRAKAPTGWTWS